MIFPTDGLLSKWGFQDGDILDDLLWDAGYTETSPRSWLTARDEEGDLWHLEHATLIVVVIAHVLPAIDQVVDTYSISTLHNPIRARTVDGMEIDEINGEYDGLLTPTEVEVSDLVITTVAGALYRPPDNHIIDVCEATPRKMIER